MPDYDDEYIDPELKAEKKLNIFLCRDILFIHRNLKEVTHVKNRDL